MLSRGNFFILGLAVLGATAGGWLQYRSRLPQVPAGVVVAHVGDLRPDLLLTGVDGKQHRLSEFHGRRVLINFWASWCVPCVAEMPALQAAGHKFADQGAIVLGIAMDSPDQVDAFLARHPVDYPILLGQMDSPSTTTSLRFGDVEGVLPFSVLVNEDGRIVAVHSGPLDPARLARWLSPAASF